MIFVKVICFLVVVEMGSAKITSRDVEGYPVGYLSNCPGSNKEARITAKSLRNLKLLVMHNSNLFNKTAYNYYQMQALSRHMDFTKKTVVMVNGYLDSNYLTQIGPAMGSVYKRLGYNVLLLEYLAFNTVVFPKAARLLRPVGKHTAEMLVELTKLGLNPKKLELIGVSLGGQAISFIAKSYREITGRNVSRITGLDPSGPCFRFNKPEDRIDASDADFVDIVHANIEGYGLAGAVGHIDFYVNGGEYQSAEIEVLPCTSLCSHSRSYFLWLGALLNPNLLIAMQCDSIQDARDRNCFDRKPFVTNVLGLKADKSKQGIFYLMTNNVFPYGLGMKGLKKENDVYDNTLKEYNKDDVLVM